MKIIEENCDYKRFNYWINGNYVAIRKAWIGTCFEKSHIEKRGTLYRKCLISNILFEYFATFEDMNAKDWIVFEKE